MSKSSSSSLPPSKRFKPNNHQHQEHEPIATILPAKKRVFAPQQHELPHSPLKEPNWVTPDSPRNREEKPVKPDNKDDDDGVFCNVCRGADGDPLDPIVFCDGCDLAVHSSCYGDPLRRSIPAGDWFCSTCMHGDPTPPCCCLCPMKGGAMKATVNGGWAHILCSLLVPEVFFRDPLGREGVDLSRVPVRRWVGECCLCRSREGCIVECSEERCRLGFHAMCGVEAELCVEYREGKNGGIVVGFCKEHTEIWKKQQLSGKFTFVPRERKEKRKR